MDRNRYFLIIMDKFHVNNQNKNKKVNFIQNKSCYYPIK